MGILDKPCQNQIIQDDVALCEHLAKLAGDVLLQIQNCGEYAQDQMGKIADKRANEAIIKEIKYHRPNDAILSEESLDDGARFNNLRVWIIDPLDGTLEFSQMREDWAVHIGLAVSGEAKIGAVAIPKNGQIYTSAALETKSLAKSLRTKPIMVISRSRPPKAAAALAEYLDAQIIEIGSSGFKAMAIIDGTADIYFHTGGQSEWDNCAPIAVAKSYGLYAGDIFGDEIRYNKRDINTPTLLICRKDLAHKIFAWTNLNLADKV